jgi:hypothetical protein
MIGKHRFRTIDTTIATLLLNIVSIRNMCAYIVFAQIVYDNDRITILRNFSGKKYYPSHSCRTPQGLYPL